MYEMNYLSCGCDRIWEKRTKKKIDRINETNDGVAIVRDFILKSVSLFKVWIFLDMSLSMSWRAGDCFRIP